MIALWGERSGFTVRLNLFVVFRNLTHQYVVSCLVHTETGIFENCIFLAFFKVVDMTFSKSGHNI